MYNLCCGGFLYHRFADDIIEREQNLIASLNLSIPPLPPVRTLCQLDAHLGVGFISYSQSWFDAGLEHVAQLKALTHLNLRDCRLLTNDGLRRLAPVVGLKSLALSNASGVTDKGLQCLADLKGISQLRHNSSQMYVSLPCSQTLPYRKEQWWLAWSIHLSSVLNGRSGHSCCHTN